MNSNYFIYQPIISHNHYLQTSLVCAMIFREELPSRLPDPIQQIQNLPKLDIRYPIENSDNFFVNVVDGDNIKKCTLQDLARLVPKDLLEGILEPKIEAGELIIARKKIPDPQYYNKILIATGNDSYAVIPNHLIMEIREEEKQIEKIKKAYGEEQDAIFNPALWGGNVNAISIEKGNQEKILIFAPNNLSTVILKIDYDKGAGSTIRRPNVPITNSSQQDLSIELAPKTIRTTKVDKPDITRQI